jgi:hypothetical protein
MQVGMTRRVRDLGDVPELLGVSSITLCFNDSGARRGHGPPAAAHALHAS